MDSTQIRKNVFIVGASQGIGKALALEFAKNNWNCFLASRNVTELEELNNYIIGNYKVQCGFHNLDVTNINDFESALKVCLAKFEKVDLVILNSGISSPIDHYNLDLNIARSIFETNLFGILNGLKVFVEYFKTQGKGKIAIVSSLADSRGFPGSSVYAASKAAVSHISEAARLELLPHNIEVITIKPGFVRTEMTAKHTFYMPFLMNSERAAKIIFRGLIKGKKRIYFPFLTAFSSYILKILPSFVYEYIFKNWK